MRSLCYVLDKIPHITYTNLIMYYEGYKSEKDAHSREQSLKLHAQACWCKLCVG